MSHYRIYHKLLGGHVHMRVFSGTGSEVTFGKCGDLCMTAVEFADFKEMLKRSNIEFINEGVDGRRPTQDPTTEADE